MLGTKLGRDKRTRCISRIRLDAPIVQEVAKMGPDDLAFLDWDEDSRVRGEELAKCRLQPSSVCDLTAITLVAYRAPASSPWDGGSPPQLIESAAGPTPRRWRVVHAKLRSKLLRLDTKAG